MVANKTFSRVMLKKYYVIFVLTLSMIVYFIPYIAIDYYNQFIEAYALTDSQLGSLMTYFGMTAVPGYFIGGWLADKFNPKKMVIASCVGTGLVAIAVAFVSSYEVLLVLHLLYGITGTVLNWGAYLKIIRMLGEDDEQGRLYGVSDISYGLFGLIIEYVIVALTVTYLVDHPMGFKFAILVYAGLSILFAIWIYFVVPDTKGKKIEDDEDKIRLSLILKVLKMPIAWYVGLFTMGYFIIRSSISYLNPYLTDAFGMNVALATSLIWTFRMAIPMFMSPFGGYIRDRLGGRATPVVMIGASGAFIFLIALALVPMEQALMYLVVALGFFILACTGFVSSCLYTPLTEAKVSIAYTGTIFGIASAVGYSTDLWLYNLCGTWIDNLGNDGYTNIWYLTAGGAAIMLVTGSLLWKEYKKVRNADVTEVTA